MKFFVEKIRVQKLLTFFFSTKNISEFQIFTFEIFYETLTNYVVSFEQPGPVHASESVDVDVFCCII